MWHKRKAINPSRTFHVLKCERKPCRDERFKFYSLEEMVWPLHFILFRLLNDHVDLTLIFFVAHYVLCFVVRRYFLRLYFQVLNKKPQYRRLKQGFCSLFTIQKKRLN